MDQPGARTMLSRRKLREYVLAGVLYEDDTLLLRYRRSALIDATPIG